MFFNNHMISARIAQKYSSNTTSACSTEIFYHNHTISERSTEIFCNSHTVSAYDYKEILYNNHTLSNYCTKIFCKSHTISKYGTEIFYNKNTLHEYLTTAIRYLIIAQNYECSLSACRTEITTVNCHTESFFLNWEKINIF